MLSRVIISSLALAALANGLVFKRDDGYSSSTPAPSLPTMTPQPVLLPDGLSLPPLNPSSTGNPADTPLSSLSLPPLNPSPTGTLLSSLSLPPLDPSPTGTSTDIPLSSLSLPPLNPSSTGTPADVPLPSLSLPPLDPSPTSTPLVVTTTVYVYPTQCSPTGTPSPSPNPSGVSNLIISMPDNGGVLTLPPPAQPTPLNLPPVRRGAVRRDDATVGQLRALQQQVLNTWVDLGKGDRMMSVVGQLENLIDEAAAPGADGPALLKQANALVQS